MITGQGPRRRSRGAACVAGDRGALSVEMAILTPLLLIVIAVAIYGGRFVSAEGEVKEAARSAARTASIASDARTSQATAEADVRSKLDNGNSNCSRVSISIDTSGFFAPIGQPAQVTVTITCVIELADLAIIPGLPGTQTIKATFSSPLDSYRVRTPPGGADG